ncbi:hypothetical protein [Escherichia coli]|uniref:hypothetical protein n=1 Tax=Escherichia coli TaxID=562 RepID=UPI0013B38AC4|nr:hypothetical protein [Escherichia coli]
MSLPVLGTFTSANWAGAYPFDHTFVHDATGASALLLMVTNAGGYTWDPTATFAGVSMTLLARAASTTSQGTTWVFGLNNPPQTSGSIVINSPFNYGDIGVSSAINLSNTHATAPFSIATAIYNANTSTASLTTPATDHILIGVGHSHYANGVPLTVTGGTAFNSNTTNVNHVQTIASQNAVAAGTYEMSFTAPFNMVGVGLVAVSGGAGGGVEEPPTGTKVGIDGESSSVVNSSGVVRARRGVRATSTTAIAVSGAIRAKRGIQATSTISLTAAGSARVKRAYSAVSSSSVIVTAIADLTVNTPVGELVELVGGSEASSSAIGALGVRRAVLAVSQVRTLSNGSIRAKRSVSGISSTSHHVEGKLNKRRPVSALSSTSTAAAGQAIVKRSLTGLSSFSVISEARTSTTVPLSGEVSLSTASLGLLRQRVRYSGLSTHSLTSAGSTSIKRTFRGASTQSMQTNGFVQLKRGLLGTSLYSIDSIGVFGRRLTLLGDGVVGIDSLGNLIIKTKFPASLNITLSYKRVKVTGDDPITVTLEEVSEDYDVVLRESIALTTRTHEDLGTFDVQTNEII